MTGLRDFAILTMLARLGLRAGETAAMETGDIDWRAGEIVIRGKGRRDDRMPLPPDAGCALAAWLAGGRPAGPGCRTVFVTRHAPVRPMRPNTVARVVMFACERAGLPVIRSHRLRHAAATHLLAAGAPLPEISQVLRHRDLATTAVYAKVDMASLRQVAAPWAGAVLTIRETKFGKSRLVPLHDSAAARLHEYARVRGRLMPHPESAAFFTSLTGTRLIYPNIHRTFSALVKLAGTGAGSPATPRIHDSATASPSAPCCAGIATGTTSSPGCPGCRPTSATASHATPTGT